MVMNRIATNKNCAINFFLNLVKEGELPYYWVILQYLHSFCRYGTHSINTIKCDISTIKCDVGTI